MTHKRIWNRRGDRGAASVEAVIVLPVFVILFVGLFFLRDLVHAKLEAAQEARRCAWEYSNNACTTESEGCGGVVARTGFGWIHQVVDDALDQGVAALRNGSLSREAVGKILETTVKEAIAHAFSGSLDATKRIERERPGMFGGGKSQVTGKYRMACNLPTQDDVGIAKAVFRQIVP